MLAHHGTCFYGSEQNTRKDLQAGFEIEVVKASMSHKDQP
jgi:hypothetical protein